MKNSLLLLLSVDSSEDNVEVVCILVEVFARERMKLSVSLHSHNDDKGETKRQCVPGLIPPERQPQGHWNGRNNKNLLVFNSHLFYIIYSSFVPVSGIT